MVEFKAVITKFNYIQFCRRRGEKKNQTLVFVLTLIYTDYCPLIYFKF